MNVSIESISPKPKPMLSIMNVLNYDIPPKSCTQNSYHPHIIEACRVQIDVWKATYQLSPEEEEHCNGYQEYKIRNRLPIEEHLLYKPA
jgi:hypothetical protein